MPSVPSHHHLLPRSGSAAKPNHRQHRILRRVSAAACLQPSSSPVSNDQCVKLCCARVGNIFKLLPPPSPLCPLCPCTGQTARSSVHHRTVQRYQCCLKLRRSTVVTFLMAGQVQRQAWSWSRWYQWVTRKPVKRYSFKWFSAFRFMNCDAFVFCVMMMQAPSLVTPPYETFFTQTKQACLPSLYQFSNWLTKSTTCEALEYNQFYASVALSNPSRAQQWFCNVTGYPNATHLTVSYDTVFGRFPLNNKCFLSSDAPFLFHLTSGKHSLFNNVIIEHTSSYVPFLFHLEPAICCPKLQVTVTTRLKYVIFSVSFFVLSL